VPIGHKDNHKTFFFFSEEARRIITYTTLNPTLPTQGMLQARSRSDLPGVHDFLPDQRPRRFRPASIIRLRAEYIKESTASLRLRAKQRDGTLPSSSRCKPVQQQQEIARGRPHLQRWFRYGASSKTTVSSHHRTGGLFTGAALPTWRHAPNSPDGLTWAHSDL